MATLVIPLKKAGVAVPPVIQRAWQWLKDNGAHDASACASALGLPVNSISSTMGILRDRDMVTSKKELDQSSGQPRFVYKVNPKLKKYELWPVTAAAKARPKRGDKAAPKTTPDHSFTQAGTAHLAPLPIIPTPSILDTLNVRDAYALYLELHNMFNPVTPVAKG